MVDGSNLDGSNLYGVGGVETDDLVVNDSADLPDGVVSGSNLQDGSVDADKLADKSGSASETGQVADGDNDFILTIDLADQETLTVTWASLKSAQSGAPTDDPPTSLDLTIRSADNTTTRSTIISGDGSTDEETGDTTYQNTTGGVETVGVAVENGTGNAQNVSALCNWMVA